MAEQIDWDERARRAASAHYDVIFKELDPKSVAVVVGVRAAREVRIDLLAELRADAAVERLAASLDPAASELREDWPLSWEAAKDRAREHIAALLGEQE